jgi:DNA polymerase I-like protein with 3'-5' exonuclease and polymerase domains
VDFTVLDFESYFDSDYTLKRLTTEEYVRDPRFKIHCAAVYSGEKQEIFTDNFAKNLAPYMGDFIICQHAQFDGLILSHHLGLFPKYWGCTLSMARAQLQNLKSHSLSALCEHYGLAEKTIDYNAFRGALYPTPPVMQMLTEGCLHDAELTYTIAEKLLENFPPQELQIIDKTIRMFTEGCLCLDAPRLSVELKRIKAAKQDALEELDVTKEQLQSAKKFSALLEICGVEVPMKISPKTGKEIPAIAKNDEAMKALLEHENETVAALAAARLGQKSTLMETRCERLLGMDKRGYLPVYLKYHGAHTGRWSGGDKVNFQNFPRGSELRKSILAPEGYKLIGVDSAQIECRLLNWFAGQANIVEAFKTGRDIYCENASKFFDRQITKNDNGERQFGKVIELASGYGCGHIKFKTISLQQAKRRLTDEEAKRAIDIYRNGHPRVVGLWKCFQQVVRDMGKGLPPYQIGCVTIDGYKIIMPEGTFLDYTGMYWDGENYRLGKSKIYGGLVVENIIQKLGYLVVVNAIINIDDKYGYKLATTTHDDVLYVVRTEDTEALKNVIAEFKQPPEWCLDCPLSAEGFESERFDK